MPRISTVRLFTLDKEPPRVMVTTGQILRSSDTLNFSSFHPLFTSSGQRQVQFWTRNGAQNLDKV